jgi:NDP-sugar pyrophosphorylase family protein
MQLIIPMSGSGKRFRDAGYKDPKPLIRVDGLPMIEHVVSLFPGVTDVTFICNSDDIQNTDIERVLSAICPTCNIVVIEPHKKGPVWAVLQALEFINDEEVIISYCDYGTQWDFKHFLHVVRGGHFAGAIAGYRGFHPHMLGSDNYAFCREKDGTLLEIREKAPFTEDRMSEFASNGTYYFAKGSLVKQYFRELIDKDINIKDEYYVSLVYNLMVRDGLLVKLFEIEKMLQWGTPHDLEIYKRWSKYFRKPNFTLVIPMAGRGERFKEYDKPKPFLPINGNPMVVEAVKALPQPKDIVFVALSEHYDMAANVWLCYPDAAYVYIDAVTQGQAETCEIGLKAARVGDDDPILISACDNAAVYDQAKFFDLIDDPGVDVIVWSFTNHPTGKNNPNMYSWLDVDASGRIHDVACKRFIEGRKHAIIGTMYFRKAKYFLDGLKANRERDLRTNGEFYVDDVLNRNIEQGLKVKVFEVDDYICWGTPMDYKTYLYWADYFKK